MSTDNKEFKFISFSNNRSFQDAKNIYNQRIIDSLNFYEKYCKTFSIRVCPICGSSDYSNEEKFHKAYEISKCEICGSIYVNPVPSIIALEDYYNNSKCNKMLQELYNKRADKKSDFFIDDRVKLVIKYLKQFDDKKNIKILEIGCGNGSFLTRLKYFIREKTNYNSIELYGIDIDQNAINNNIDNKLILSCSSAEEYIKSNSENFDIILHFELIEHLIDPYSFMVRVKKLLKNNGIVLFSTPNSNGLEIMVSDYNSFRPIAGSIFPPFHLNAFNTMNIYFLSIRSGYSIIDIITPGKLDVDLVSLMNKEINDKGIKALAKLDVNTKGLFQYIISLVKASSHMVCIIKNNK